MDYFERAPWLLIPLIIVTMEVWQGVKALLRRSLSRPQSERIREQ
jgi:hypothetical protein